jgi:nitroimidazol reductase NimA-like FMN-containing flavoprotein (pyridoxamine 5'-phosphate oxidase superfamily)
MTGYHMQKSEREITEKTVLEEILKHGRFAVIALCRENDPYLVTLSYGYDPMKRSLYFHTARKGLKLEYLKANPSVCATIIEDRGYIMGECAHAYRSVVVRGKMAVVEILDEKKHGMEVMLGHLEIDPDVVRKRSLPDDKAYARAAILKLDILEMTGKAGR